MEKEREFNDVFTHCVHLAEDIVINCLSSALALPSSLLSLRAGDTLSYPSFYEIFSTMISSADPRLLGGPTQAKLCLGGGG